MNSDEYHLKLSNAKNKSERDKINTEFMKQNLKSNKHKAFKSFCINNAFNIINVIITLLALIVAVLSLSLQLQEH